jgi:chemotaxis protein MotB
MALQRSSRRGGGHSPTIWPGFVDAMTGLLLVLMFVLTIFTVVQFVLRDEITGQQDRLNQLTSEVASLTSALGLERDRSAALEGSLEEAGALSDAQAALIASLTAERDATRTALTEAQVRITGFEAQVAGLLAERSDLRASVADLSAERTSLLTEQQALELALATARDEIDAAAEQARLAAARREAMEALITRLQNTTGTQGEEIDAAEAQRLLDAAAAEALRAQLADADAELTAMTLALEEQRRRAEETLTLLAAAEAARDDLDVRLAATILARDRAEADLAAALSGAADLDARLLAALSLQETTAAELAAARAALDATTGDLETRLAAALAAGAQAQGDLAAAEQRLEAALAAAETDRAALQDRLTRALLAQSALRAEQAARAALADPDRVADLEEQLSRALAARDGALADRRNAEAEADALAARLAAALEPDEDARRAEALARETGDLRAALAEALAARDRAETETTLAMTEAERQAALLATAQDALSREEALSADSLRQVAVLNEQVAALRAEVAQLQSLLDLAETEDVAARVRIESLGAQLNTALARAAAEERRRAELEEAERIRLQAEAERLAAEAQDLERYRSEFFGRLRDVVAGQEGIRIEGDRFVFSSEVLFDPGRVELSPEGQAGVAGVGAILRTIIADIPPGIDWVIRVDGHTDTVPLSGQGAFADNWELSQARALSVVRYLIEREGIPPERLAANGFGEFQPLVRGDTAEARAQNRRIEIKLTER